MGNVLVIAEHLHGKFPKTTLVGLTAGKTLAEKAGGKCLAVVLGSGIDGLANDLASYGVDVVAVDGAPFEHYVADAYTAAIADVVKEKGVEDVVATATAVGKDLLPRLAARLGAGMVSDISGIVDATTFVRPMWAGNLFATVKVEGTPRVISVRGTAFPPATPGVPEAVLLRALEPLEGIDLMRARRGLPEGPVWKLCRGPGALCRAIGLTRAQDGADLVHSRLRIVDAARTPTSRIARTARIGVAYAGTDALRPWRFLVRGSFAVSGRRLLA